MISQLQAQPEECFFWAAHAGAELDLLVLGRRLEGSSIRPTRRSFTWDHRELEFSTNETQTRFDAGAGIRRTP